MLCQSTSSRIPAETTCRSTEKEMITMSGLSCLVCDANLDVSSCANVFYTSLPRSGEPLVNFVSRVLRVTLADLRGSYVCSQCYNLFEMLEQAQRTVASIRCEIFKAYCANGRDKAMKQTLNEESELSMGNAVPEQQNLVEQDKGDDTEGLWLKRIDNLAPDNADTSYRIEDKILSFGLESLPVDTNFDTNTDKDSKRDVKGRIEDEKETDAKGEKYDKSVLINEIFRESITNESKEYVRNNVQTKEEPYNHARCKLCGTVLFLNNECDVRLSKCNSQTYQCEKCKKNFPNISVASTNANRMHNEEKNNSIAITETTQNETKNAARVESIFHENKLQTPDISESVDFAWNHIEENLTETKTGLGDESPQHKEGKQGKSSRCNPKIPKYSCPTCGKKWKTSAELKTHIKTHSTLRPYMCEKCGQAYKHKHALEIHVGMHNGINPFKCSFCNKCFTQKGALMRHLPMHTGEKPYQCELCGKRFIHHTSYNMHRLSHTGKKSYKCHVCDMSLLSTSHLKRHMRVHTGEKPYNCTLCGKRFAERYNLLAHQKIHDPSETKSKKIEKSRHKCDRCDLTFEEKQSLDDHLKFHPDMNGVAKEKEYPIQTENAIGEGWVQVNRSKLEDIDGQAKFVLLPNSLSQIHDDSFAVAFTDEKISLENGNYNASLQVIIQSSDAPVLSNHVTVDNTQI